MEQNVRPFGLRDKAGYMFGDFGNDFTFILSSMFLLKFYTDVMGVPAGVVGIMMMAARVVDAVTDVAMGQIVDRTKPTERGKFVIWIRRMCGPVAVASFLMYASWFAHMPLGFKIFWMFLAYSVGECVLYWDQYSVWFDGIGNFRKSIGPCTAVKLENNRCVTGGNRDWSRDAACRILSG